MKDILGCCRNGPGTEHNVIHLSQRESIGEWTLMGEKCKADHKLLERKALVVLLQA